MAVTLMIPYIRGTCSCAASLTEATADSYENTFDRARVCVGGGVSVLSHDTRGLSLMLSVKTCPPLPPPRVQCIASESLYERKKMWPNY